MESKRKYKIIFPTGHLSKNVINDNIDVYVIFENKKCFFGVLVTLENVRSFIDRGDLFFWIPDMLIIKDLKKETIEQTIASIINDESYTRILDHIGIFDTGSYEDIIHLNDKFFLKE